MRLSLKVAVQLCVLTGLFLVCSTDCFCQGSDLEDVVYLKDGSIIRGTIIEQIPGESLKIQTRDGSVFVYQMDEISRIAKEEQLVKPAEVSKAPIGSKKEPVLAFALSFLIPGGGQFYNGEGAKGGIMLGVASLGAILLIANIHEELTTWDSHDDFDNEGLAFLGVTMVLGSAIWSMIDAPISASRINRERGWTIAPDKIDNLYLSVTDLRVGGETTPGLQLKLMF